MNYRELETTAVKALQSKQATEHQNQEHDNQSIHKRQPGPLSHIIGSMGGISANAYASVLNRIAAFPSSRAQVSLLQLHRQYGNRYVQRVLTLSRKAEGETEATPEVNDAIQQARGSGQALDSGIRMQMEPAFNTDFSAVRVHTDIQADTLSQSLNARAFTTGHDIFFKQGTYNPGSSSGRQLLAHELTHVVQQNGQEVKRKLTIGQPGDKYEIEADQVARAVIQQEQHTAPTKDVRSLLQRQAEEEEEERVAQGKIENGGLQRQGDEEEEED